MSSPTSTGRAAEQLAAEHQDYHIIDRNWCNRWWELDIVARRGIALDFIELKYRVSTAFGLATEYINHNKTAGRSGLQPGATVTSGLTK